VAGGAALVDPAQLDAGQLGLVGQRAEQVGVRQLQSLRRLRSPRTRA
jgi:hypothetical protein